MRGIWTRITLASWLAAVSSAEPLFLRRTSSQHSLNWWHSRSRHLFQSGPSIALLSLMHETRRWFRCHDISLLTFAGFVQSYLGRKWWEVMHGWLEREGANDVDFCISTGHFWELRDWIAPWLPPLLRTLCGFHFSVSLLTWEGWPYNLCRGSGKPKGRACR